MALISLNSIRKSFGAFQVLDEATFTIGSDEKVALVGPNGSGKTTVLRIIGEMEDFDTGTLSILPGTSVGFMPQDTELSSDQPLLEEVSNASSEIKEMERVLRRLEHAMSAADADEMESLLAEYGEVQHEFDRLGGYAFEAEVKSTLSGLALGAEHWEKPVSILSGGQKARAALAKLLLLKPDILMLDEPTNHLDIQATEWLEEFLIGFPGAVLIVSHDRYFLDRVVTKIVDLHEACTHSYHGNYTAYMKQKQEILRQKAEGYERQQDEIHKLEYFISRYHAGQRHREAKSREKRLAKMVRHRKPKSETEKMRLKLDSAEHSGHIVMDFREIGKSFDSQVLFTGLNAIIEKGDRVGIVGPNGAGKTTLLRIIVGDEEPSIGTISLGYNVEIGYFSQDLTDLDALNTVLEELLEFADLTPGEARNFLARFLFTGDDVFKSVSKLSGGERNRLVLAKLMLRKPNVLVLDEPTNHLDIDSRQALDEALKDFDGTVVLTSHDRYLLNSICTRIIEIDRGTARIYNGNYDFFVDRSAKYKPRPPKRKQKPKQSASSRTASTKGRKSEDLEREIEALESRLAEIVNTLGNSETYLHPELASTSVVEYENLQKELEQLYAEWETLL